MTVKSLYDRIPRVVAFLWGFAFIHLFKYNLEKIYPFWNEVIGLSFFAYILIFISWAAYTFSFFYQKDKYKNFTFFLHLVFLVNSGIFLFLITGYGEENYLYASPLLFSLQLGVYVFLFTTTLRFVIAYRISLVAGAVAGILSYQYVGSIYIDILLPAVLYILTSFTPESGKPAESRSHLRMAVLRESIDFLRYLFLGLALFGAFDQFRGNFYLIVFILSIGPLLSYILLKADKKKHHVKYGIVFLGIFFAGFAVISNSIHINFSSAIGFSFFTIWEGIYFKKTAEGYLRREIILSGIALFISLVFYFIAVEWMILISAIIVILTQLRILNYIAKGYRKAIAIIFFISLAGWSFSLYLNYNKSYKREFIIPLKTQRPPAPPSLAVLGFFNDRTKTFYTNIFPEEVIENFSKDHPSKLNYKNAKSPFLLGNIKSVYRRDPASTQLLNLNHLKSYRSSPGIDLLRESIISNNIKNVFFYDNNDKSITTGRNDIIDFSLANTFMTRDEILLFGKTLAVWYNDHKEYDYAVSIYKELIQAFEQTDLYRSIAHVYGITGNIEGQIEFREKVYQRADSTFEDKLILLELYFLFGKTQSANEICETLIQRHPTDISLYEWKYKIISTKKNRYQLEQLKYKLYYLPNLSREQIFKRDNLVLKINDDLKSLPLWNEIYNTEKRRQENIAYPE